MGEPAHGMGKLVSYHYTLQVWSQLDWLHYRTDYMQGTRLSFRSKEDAIHFAEKQGE